MHHALVERIYSLIIVILDEMNSDDNYDYIFKVGGTEAADRLMFFSYFVFLLLDCPYILYNIAEKLYTISYMFIMFIIMFISGVLWGGRRPPSGAFII